MVRLVQERHTQLRVGHGGTAREAWHLGEANFLSFVNDFMMKNFFFFLYI